MGQILWSTKISQKILYSIIIYKMTHALYPQFFYLLFFILTYTNSNILMDAKQ